MNKRWEIAVFEQLKLLENDCERATIAYIEENVISYDEPWRNFQLLFRHLYNFSCFYWGNHGKERVLEHLAGKTVTNASVAVRAIFHGYYDESLALIRNIGEIANLVNLFWHDVEKIREWIDSDEKTRRRTFSPVKVREMIESKGMMVPVDREHYSFFCETSVHPVPHKTPNAYNDRAQPVLGLVFQEEGFALAFWNLLWSTSVVCGPIAKLALLHPKKAEELMNLTIPVFRAACESGVPVPHTRIQSGG